jgi:hypothetical protein
VVVHDGLEGAHDRELLGRCDVSAEVLLDAPEVDLGGAAERLPPGGGHRGERRASVEIVGPSLDVAPPFEVVDEAADAAA